MSTQKVFPPLMSPIECLAKVDLYNLQFIEKIVGFIVIHEENFEILATMGNQRNKVFLNYAIEKTWFKLTLI